MARFSDLFSESSADYAKYRPQYPNELFSYIASISNAHNIAWDCATGTGQSARGLANYFAQVIASDASPRQIQNAVRKDKIAYCVTTAERSSIASKSVDAITVAQALHWFDLEDFANEVRRVLKPDGVLAVWTYNLLSVQPAIDEVIERLYSELLAGHWPSERTLVESGYSNIQLPFTELKQPAFRMSAVWDLSQLCGYLNTWSAVKAYQRTLGVNPVETLFYSLSEVWGDPKKLFTIEWPLNVKIWINSV